MLDLKRLRRLGTVDPASATVTAGAGIVGQHLEDDLNRAGWTLGHFPSSIFCSTLGGWIAARSAGQFSSRYGKIEDMVRSLRVALPDGRRMALDGDRDGPDWAQVVTGSEGTLAVVTEATLAVQPLPEHRIAGGWRFADVAAGLEGMRCLMQAGLRPCVARLYDEFDTLLALSGHGSAEAGGGGGLRRRLSAMVPDAVGEILRLVKRRGLGVALDHTEWLNRAVDLLPGGCLLVLGFEGERSLIAAEQVEAETILTRRGAESLGEGPGRRWYSRRYSISYKQPPTYAAGAWVDTMEVATTWREVVPLYDAVRAAVRDHVFVMAHFSHAYTDGCSIYFTFAGRRGAGPAALALYDATWNAALSAVVACGATLSHLHGVGLSKARRMTDEQGPGGRQLFDAAKAGFDADRTMNPGKLWWGEARPTAPTPRRPRPAGGSDVVALDRRSLLVRVRPDCPVATLLSHAAAFGTCAGPWPDGASVRDVLDGPGGRLPSPRYGTPRERVVAVRAELPGGEVLDTRAAPRKAVGPDYLRMVIGSAGELGELEEVTLRLWPAPETERDLTWRFSSAGAAAATRRAVLNAGVRPALERRERRLWSLTLHGPERLLDAETGLIAREAQAREGRPVEPARPPSAEPPRPRPPTREMRALTKAARAWLLGPDQTRASGGSQVS